MSDKPKKGKKPPVVKDNPVPPVDDTFSCPNPPSTGQWCICATDGVIPTPITWGPK